MNDDRLPTDLWVRAHMRRCEQEGAFATILHRGDKTGGLVVLKLHRLGEGSRILTQTRDLEGRLAWMPALERKEVTHAEADAYIARTVKRDPDVWVIEIESKEGWHPFEGREL